MRDQSIMVYRAIMVPNTFSCEPPYIVCLVFYEQKFRLLTNNCDLRRSFERLSLCEYCATMPTHLAWYHMVHGALDSIATSFDFGFGSPSACCVRL